MTKRGTISNLELQIAHKQLLVLRTAQRATRAFKRAVLHAHSRRCNVVDSDWLTYCG